MRVEAPCPCLYSLHFITTAVSGLGPFPRPTKTLGTSIESRAAGAGYKGTAARLGPPLNTLSARSLAPRHENSCVFPLPSSFGL